MPKSRLGDLRPRGIGNMTEKRKVRPRGVLKRIPRVGDLKKKKRGHFSFFWGCTDLILAGGGVGGRLSGGGDSQGIARYTFVEAA